MKTRFNTFDIICVVGELQQYIGMRVNNIYDIDNKTFLIKLQRTEEKAVILLESGVRIHSTAFEWPKNMAPSGFSMKMRKHIRNKRLESLTQIGVDRIIDLQFGSGEAAYHVILELYDRGNLILTDHELRILYILRPHTEGDSVKFFVKEIYPQNRGREYKPIVKEDLENVLQGCKPGDQLKKVLVSKLEYGPALIEHVLIGKGIKNNCKIGKSFNISTDFEELFEALKEADEIFKNSERTESKGYIIQKKEDKISKSEDDKMDYFLSNQEFHPFLYRQHEESPYKEFDCFNIAIDEFFSSMEYQKIELRALQQEKEAMKKLENVRKDHKQRLVALEKTQELDKQKAELITRNQEVVEKAILAVQSALANQLPWEAIKDLVKEAASQGDPIAQIIKELKLERNHITLYLTDPYKNDDTSDEEEQSNKIEPMTVDVDLALSAFANATRYYNQKRNAAKKQEKTIKSQTVALKSAEKKTKQTLKEVETITNIQKARKVYWFEKFFWFISSENYLIIAGRDQQQNELLVKRYLKPTDVYVHADIHGASSIVIKNPTNQPVPPKTLNEAGTMAICYSVAWEAKVVTNAYWVWGDQVSKTAPTGEYLTTGSFMVRGKKNFLPPSHLILGLSFLFRLEDSFIEKHLGERKVLTEGTENSIIDNQNVEHGDEVEIDIPDEEEEEDYTPKNEINDDHPAVEKLETLAEEVVDSDSSESEQNVKYPDTQLRIEHKSDTINILAQPTTPNEKEIASEFLANLKPLVSKKNENINKNKQKSKQTKENNIGKNIAENNVNKQQIKRGQKSKLKKIKEKYKDQDEEERQLRMEILQSSGTNKESKKNKKNKDSNQSSMKKPQPQFSKAPRVNKKEEDGAEEEETVQVDVDIINALTGIPTAEDELLFAVPVVAPYSTLTNYKFKVKITPGTSKKGKAAKTAVAMFMKDRTTTQREKDLLKAVKDDQLPRNFPGKVKLSAPKLQALKK